jgi:hypothetical protein
MFFSMNIGVTKQAIRCVFFSQIALDRFSRK